jgi:hypothetical protein
MTLALLHGKPGDGACGTMTTGGSESIVLMAIKAYKERARALKGIDRRPRPCCPSRRTPRTPRAATTLASRSSSRPSTPRSRHRVDAVRRSSHATPFSLSAARPAFPQCVIDPIERARRAGARARRRPPRRRLPRRLHSALLRRARLPRRQVRLCRRRRHLDQRRHPQVRLRPQERQHHSLPLARAAQVPVLRLRRLVRRHLRLAEHHRLARRRLDRRRLGDADGARRQRLQEKGGRNAPHAAAPGRRHRRHSAPARARPAAGVRRLVRRQERLARIQGRPRTSTRSPTPWATRAATGASRASRIRSAA